MVAVTRKWFVKLAMLACCVGMASSELLRVSPRLQPTSHDTFFNKDLPDDLRPREPTHFTHPFPAVQDTGDFDKDYVKDENNDNGEWKAQMHYDELRAAIDKQRAAVEAARLAEQAKRDAMEEALANNKSASEAVEAAAAAAREARAAERKVREQLEHLTGGASGHGVLRNATDDFDDANMTIEDCRRRLEEAKKRVEELRRIYKENVVHTRRKVDEQTAVVESTRQALDAQTRDDAAKAIDLEKEIAALEEKLNELRKKEKELEKKHRLALAASKEANATLADAESRLAVATDRLREVRHGQANPGGGIVRTRSAAPVCVTTFLAWLLLAARAVVAVW